jgi:hypothetical protein
VKVEVENAHRAQDPHLPAQVRVAHVQCRRMGLQPRHAFLKFKRLLLQSIVLLLFLQKQNLPCSPLDFVVGNDNYGGEWALLGDTLLSARTTRRTPLRPPHPAGVYIVKSSFSCTGFS